EMGANPNTPIGIAMKEGINASNRTKGKTLNRHTPPYRSAHGYDPGYQTMNTSFIAVGAGIGKHKNISGVGIVDVAPVVAKLLGIEFNAPDGRLVPGILKGNEN